MCTDIILSMAETSEGKASPDWANKVVIRARELHWHGDPSVSLWEGWREERRRESEKTEGEIKTKSRMCKQTVNMRINVCVYICVSANPYAAVVCVRARRCVCVSVCYVILSRPQLLSHTQQACWGSQPTGPLLPVSIFFHPSFLLSLCLPSSPNPFFFLL